MRRYVLPFVLAAASVASAASPATADPFDVCVIVNVSGYRIPSYDVGPVCVWEDWPSSVWCEDDTTAVDPDVEVRVRYCHPAIPI